MKKLFGILFGITFLLVPVFAMAQTSYTGNAPPTSYTNNTAPLPSSCQGSACQVTNPLGNINSFCGLIKALLQAAVGIGIPIAVLFIVYAGLQFVLARGNPDKLKRARENMLWTVIGIGIFLGAWLLAQLIINTVNSVGGSSNNQSLISCQ